MHVLFWFFQNLSVLLVCLLELAAGNVHKALSRFVIHVTYIIYLSIYLLSHLINTIRQFHRAYEYSPIVDRSANYLHLATPAPTLLTG